jgi:hypothetical protein
MPVCPKCQSGRTGPHPKFCTPEMRFWRKVRFAPNGCWEWTGSTNGRYGEIRLAKGVKVYAHRFAYERTWGPLDLSIVVMHDCDNTLCVRAVHLVAGTQRQNLADMMSKGRHASQRRAA